MPNFGEKYGNFNQRMPYFFIRYGNKKEKYAKLRNQTIDKLHQLYLEYLKYAHILLVGNQALEALGIVVKRKLDDSIYFHNVFQNFVEIDF